MKEIVVLDVGARGEFHPRWKRIAGRLHAIAVDADRDAAVDKPPARRYELFRTGLWREAGTQTLNITRAPGCSSFYLPNFEFLNRFPAPERYTVTRQSPIETQPLTALDRAPHFIKLDVQGAELGILQGAQPLLGGVIGIEIEVEFAPLYVDAPLFPEVDAFVRSQGFELCDLNKFYWRDLQDRRFRCVSADALYFKRLDRVADPEIAAAIADCYRITPRQSLAHAYQWVMRYLRPGQPFDADMQIGH